MQDMLVNLLEIDDYYAGLRDLEKECIEIFRAIAPDKKRVVSWVEEHSTLSAASEVDVSFSNRPISCFLAVKNEKIIGYAVYNVTALDYFGPTRVLEEYRGKGVGKALLLRSLRALKDEGYNYAIIGGVGPVNFYEKSVGATLIVGSDKYSIYNNFIGLREKRTQANNCDK